MSSKAASRGTADGCSRAEGRPCARPRGDNGLHGGALRGLVHRRGDVRGGDRAPERPTSSTRTAWSRRHTPSCSAAGAPSGWRPPRA